MRIPAPPSERVIEFETNLTRRGVEARVGECGRKSALDMSRIVQVFAIQGIFEIGHRRRETELRIDQAIGAGGEDPRVLPSIVTRVSAAGRDFSIVVRTD